MHPQESDQFEQPPRRKRYLSLRSLIKTLSWFVSQPKHSQIITIALTALVLLAILSAIFQFIHHSLTLVILAAVLYGFYRILFNPRNL